MTEPTNPNARARNGLKQLAWNEALRRESFTDTSVSYVEPAHPWCTEPCAICGESFKASDDLGEMHDPTNPEEHGGIVHAQCGLDAGWEIS